jgi:hypothetical protein
MCILLERASEVGDRDDWVFYLRLEGVCVLVSSFGEVLWSIKSTSWNASDLFEKETPFSPKLAIDDLG